MIIDGLIGSLSFQNILFMSLAITGGIVVGTLPGLSATMGVALLVPLTFGMEPATGLLVLGSLYTGAMYGGANSAILINTPGTPASVATTFDGYPMTLNGKADQALITAVIASVIGGIIGTLFLIFLSVPLASLALKFGPTENFWLAIFGLTIIASLASGSLIKGMIGGGIGLLIALIGIDPVSGIPRFTFGYRPLINGITLLPAMIGFFSIPQVLNMIDKNEKFIAPYEKKPKALSLAVRALSKLPGLLVRSSLIGTFVGMLPGAGGNVASFVAYNESKRFSKQREQYGKGCVEGVATSESANNATVSSSLIPLLTLGIPGSPVAAVLLGGLLIHGLRPGTKLFTESGPIAYTFMVGLIVANILLLIIGLLGIKYFVKALAIPTNYLAVIITVLAVIGSYSMRNSLVDIGVMFLCGVIGYFLMKVDIQPAPIVLGLILGVIAEQGFVLSYRIASAKASFFDVFFSGPINLILIAMTVLSLFTPYWVERQHKKAMEKVKPDPQNIKL